MMRKNKKRYSEEKKEKNYHVNKCNFKLAKV